MLAVTTLLITTLGTLLSFAVILTQFIGAETQTLEKLAMVQLISLMIALFFAVCVYFRLAKKSDKNPIKMIFTSMPGWLIFILILLIITALLGDLSVILARSSGQQLTNLFHLPSVCIIIFCFIYSLLYFDFNSRYRSS